MSIISLTLHSKNQYLIFKLNCFQRFLEGEMGEEVEEEGAEPGGEEAGPHADILRHLVHARRPLHIRYLSVPRRQESG